jgi:hypothetical protein
VPTAGGLLDSEVSHILIYNACNLRNETLMTISADNWLDQVDG